MQEMDTIAADLALQAILGRGPDFVGGIDNEALDFSQLEDFINSEGSQSNNTYFNESLNPAPPSTTLLTSPPATLPPPHSSAIIDNTAKRPLPTIQTLPHQHHHHSHPGFIVRHSLPESPPDSSSEHPYSPQEENGAVVGASNALNSTETGIYGTGGVFGDGGLILSSHIVVTNDGGDENGTVLHVGASENSAYGMESTEAGLDGIQTVYTNLQSVGKKRKLSQESALMVKNEPEHCAPGQLSPQVAVSAPLDDEYASSEACLSESQYQCIRFNTFQQPQWHTLCDQNLTELPTPHYRVDADKGFNFSNADDAFVCQKKNHFQITCHVQLIGDAQFVKTPDGFQKISSFHIHFYGVKHDCPTQTIRVEQSQSDRSKKAFHPVLIELVSSQVTKLTVGRLHFSETTSNNMRKKGKPNPEQRYFQLVVGLHAHTSTGNFAIVSHASQKIIVRASNPGQFESDVELCWQKGQTPDSIYHSGKIGVNTDRPDESLVVHGNIKVTGHIIQPSDVRAKKNIIECNTAEQLRNVQRLRVVHYDYEPHFAKELRRDCYRSDTGVIAQEVAEVLPEAVRPAGDLILGNGVAIENFLVVNKERIFMENIGAVKELCKVTDNLETRIDQLERINQRLNKLRRGVGGDSFKSMNGSINGENGSKLKSIGITEKCLKHDRSYSKCLNRETSEELCSNKFIQVVIVVLVLIMAFCLAAITTLYLMESARHNEFAQSVNFHTNQRATSPTANTKRPFKSSKNYASQPTSAEWPPQTNNNNEPYPKEPDFFTNTNPKFERKRPTIGRPLDCLQVDQNLETTNLCHIYCCGSSAPANPPFVLPPPPPELGFFGDAKTNGSGQQATTPLTATTGLLNLDNKSKISISTSFHSNDIEKQARQKRDAYDLAADEANSFDLNDDQLFSIILQGRNFNTTLTRKYLSAELNYNYTYDIPISKYMPDEYINVVFRSMTQANVKEIEYCGGGAYEFGCSFEEKRRNASDIKHKVNEQSPSLLLSSQSVIFGVDMADYQNKKMTYRASLRQNQGICKLVKAGSEFIEYNLHFYRHCDE